MKSKDASVDHDWDGVVGLVRSGLDALVAETCDDDIAFGSGDDFGKRVGLLR